MKLWTYTVLDRGEEIEGGNDYETQDEAQAAADERASGWTARERERFSVRVESFDLEDDYHDADYSENVRAGDGAWTDGDVADVLEPVSIRAGWYAIWPMGGGIDAVRINIMGVMCETFEHGVMCETFRRANDRRLPVVEAIEAGRTIADVSPETARIIIAAWDPDADPTLCVVERVDYTQPDIDSHEPVLDDAKYFETYAKAWAGRRAELVKVRVAQDGSVTVYDHIAGYYTSCHSLDERELRRIRQLAKQQSTSEEE